jgi:hypothetical protein
MMESGNPVNWISFPNPEFYQTTYDEIVALTGCNATFDTLKCLRGLSTEDLNAVVNSTDYGGATQYGLNTGGANWTTFAPVLDGDFIQKFTSIQLEDGEFVHVPILSGGMCQPSKL